jgi:hypothetical protein
MENIISMVTSKLSPELVFHNLSLILAAYHAIQNASDSSTRDALVLEFQGRLDALANGRPI